MQRNVLKAYAFRKQYASQSAMHDAWHGGESFCLTALPHPVTPLLVSKRDDDALKGFTHLALTDVVMGHRTIVQLEENNEEAAPAKAASRGEPGALPLGESRRGLRRKADRDLRQRLSSEALDADGQLKQASLTILAAMMASPAHAETPIAELVEKAIESAAALLHKIYGCD
jgi:hypothetical protein